MGGSYRTSYGTSSYFRLSVLTSRGIIDLMKQGLFFLSDSERMESKGLK